MSFVPDWETESLFSDHEEYECDQYYEEESNINQKKKEGNREEDSILTTDAQEEPRRTEKDVIDTREIPELKLPKRRRRNLEPTIIWRSQSRERSQSPSRDFVANGTGKSVSLLGDWRERFKIETPIPASMEQSNERSNLEHLCIATPFTSLGVSKEIDDALQLARLAARDEEYHRKLEEYPEILKCQEGINSEPDSVMPDCQRSQATMSNSVAAELHRESCETERNINSGQ